MGSNACSTKQRPEHDKPKGKAYTDIKNKKTFKADKKLCNLVEQHPQLYDKGHKGYGQKKATDEAWRTIADSLGKSVSDSGIEDPSTQNEPNFQDFVEQMEFLRPHVLNEVRNEQTENEEARPTIVFIFISFIFFFLFFLSMNFDARTLYIKRDFNRS
uniref:MADF domain-containing protein n=1 Tax=Bactrocera dorsalis TaxID=27457 RepID=A0A034W6T8_BACDO